MKRLILLIGVGSLLPAQRTIAQNQSAPNDAPALINSLQGAELFKAYCAVCHGIDAKGNGPMAKSLKTAPADLTRIAARNRGSFPATHVRQLISGEEALAAGHGTREMPIWGPIFSQIGRDQDLGRVRIDNLTRYLERLQTK